MEQQKKQKAEEFAEVVDPLFDQIRADLDTLQKALKHEFTEMITENLNSVKKSEAKVQSQLNNYETVKRMVLDAIKKRKLSDIVHFGQATNSSLEVYDTLVDHD